MALGSPLNGLIDSTVMIDVLRGHTEAAVWASEHLACAVTIYTVFEVLAGARRYVRCYALLSLCH